MPEPEFIVADIREHRPDLVELNVEYVSWVFSQVDECFGVSWAEIVGLPAAASVGTVIEKICDRSPPRGVFDLVRVGANSSWGASWMTRGNSAMPGCGSIPAPS